MTEAGQSPTQSPTKAFGFGAPEKIDISNPSEINWSEAAKFSEERVKVIENVRLILKQEEEQFVGKERAFLENAIKFLETFQDKSHEFVEEEQKNIRGLKAELQSHSQQKQEAEQEVERVKGEIHTVEHKITAASTEQQKIISRIPELADLVNPVELGKNKIKDSNDVSNDFFRWAFQALYQGTRETYDWNSFKKTAFTSDKGKGFSLKLRTLDPRNLKREDFIVGKNVVERREDILKPLEPKGKENVSARRLVDYIYIITQIGDYQEQIAQDRQTLEERQTELAKKQATAEELASHLKPTEEKVTVSEHYIETLKQLHPTVHEFIEKIKARVNIQDQYVETIRGNIQEIDPMAQSVFQTKQGGHDDCEFEREAGNKVNQTEDDRAAAHEEEDFHGDAADDHERKSQKHAAPQIDLKESEFANSKKGSCESCAMF